MLFIENITLGMVTIFKMFEMVWSSLATMDDIIQTISIVIGFLAFIIFFELHPFIVKGNVVVTVVRYVILFGMGIYLFSLGLYAGIVMLLLGLFIIYCSGQDKPRII